MSNASATTHSLNSSGGASPRPSGSGLSEPQQALVQSCLAIVEEHRTGTLAFAGAVVRLLETLPQTQDGTRALGTFIEQLTETERERARAAARGGNLTATGDLGTGTAEDEVEQPPGDTAEPAPPRVGDTNKRARDEALGPDEGEPVKKTADRSLYAWRNLPLQLEELDPLVAQTLQLKANYSVDVKQAKQELLVRADCPIFPDSLWNDILLNHYVDLDRVYTGYYALECDYRHTQTIGDVDISFDASGGGTSKTFKTIRSHGEWAIAFSEYRAAVLFVYPHRKKELAAYEKYVIGQFAAHVEPLRIVNLDRAIRIRVSRANDLSLDRFDRFIDLVTQYIVNPSGAGSARSQKRQRPNPTDAEVPICRRWNAGRCTSDACRFRHVCLNCQQKHQAKGCTGTKPGDQPSPAK